MSEDSILIISSDGHAGAPMKDYRPYLDPQYREEFDDFLVEWDQHGSRNFDRPALTNRLDMEFVDEWSERMVDTGRVDGYTDPAARLKEQEREGVCAEVLFPDFGLPFELYNKSLALLKGRAPVDAEHKQAAARAFNRWVADFVGEAPDRFAAMGFVSWHRGAEDAVADIRAAHASGLKGIVLPDFNPRMPLYHPDFEPVWQVLDELGMIVNSHAGFSSTSDEAIIAPGSPHPACAFRTFNAEFQFMCRNLLSHLVWGGVLERYPNLKFVFTEMTSAWVLNTLLEMDYIYDGSYYRTDYKEVIKSKPSDYFARQCYLGSSIFSRAEVAARHRIGMDKMMLGMDFPHHEGTLLESTKVYLRATLGAEGVPLDEARRLLAGNAAEVYGFDTDRLAPIAAEIGFKPDDILTAPEEDLFPRGDVRKPLC